MRDNEFEIIEKYLKPLAPKEALGLADDAAVFDVPSGFEIVIAADAISSGIHFLGNETGDLVASRLLRTNLSDMAAMGALPKYYLITGGLPKSAPQNFVKDFCERLGLEQKQFSVALLGGDSIAQKNDITYSMTMIGLVKKGQYLRRAGAKSGDDIYVSGTLGDGALFLKHKENEHFKEKFSRPMPRIELGQKLVGLATACIDVSDGLCQDLGHLVSNAEVKIDAVPISDAAPQHKSEYIDAALYGGDDYELLFTAPGDAELQIKRLEKELDLRITKIGRVKSEGGIVLNNNGELQKPKKAGYNHF